VSNERVAPPQTVLAPAEIVALIDWPSLAVMPGSFVKTNLQKLHSDLLFSVRIGSRETMLYLLFEHQSTPDLAASLLPFLPRFQHALLDLTRRDPANEENDTQLRVVLQLMKLARQKELLRFFQWLAKIPARELPDNLLSLMLLYALYSDSDFDAKRIYHTLTTNPELEKNIMSVAEKLKAEGQAEGQEKGLWIGKIQAFEEFLARPLTPSAALSSLTLEELETRHRELHQAYELYASSNK
jgi:predicted transposase YdaD